MSKRIFYDAVGKEIKVGTFVAVPHWRERCLIFGKITKLNTRQEINIPDDPFHKIDFYIGDYSDQGEWRGSNIISFSEEEATMIRLRNCEAFR